MQTNFDFQFQLLDQDMVQQLQNLQFHEQNLQVLLKLKQ